MGLSCKANDSGGYVMFFGYLMIGYLRRLCLVKSRGFAHLAALGLVSMMLRCVIVKTVELVKYRPWDTQDRLLWRDMTKSYLVHT